MSKSNEFFIVKFILIVLSDFSVNWFLSIKTVD